MTDPRHARILANIAAEVARKYTLTRSGSTTDPEQGNVPVPGWNYTLTRGGATSDPSRTVFVPVVGCVYAEESHHSDDMLAVYHGSTTPTRICGYHEQRFGVPARRASVDPSWNYTLPERYQAQLGSRPILNDGR